MDPVTDARDARRRLFGGLFAAPILSGVLLSLAFPAANLWPLAWGALAPWYVSLLRNPAIPDTGRPARPGALLTRLLLSGFAAGLTLFLFGMYWMSEIGIAPYLILSAIQAVPFALLAVVLWIVLPRLSPWLRPVAFAAFWTLFEAIRSAGTYAFPWFLLAASQVRSPEMLQIAAVTGQWGVSFAVAAANACVAEAWLARAERRRAFRFAAAALAVPALLATGGAIALRGSAEPPESARRVAAIQGNFIKPPDMYREEARSSALRTYIGLSHEAAEQGAELAVWPETVVPGVLLRDYSLFAPVSGLARYTRMPLLIGSIDVDDRGRMFNAALLLDGEGEIAGRYEKTHLVPLGEFFPLRRALGTFYRAYGAPEQDMSPGNGTGLLRIERAEDRIGRLGVLICYESAFGRLAARRVRGGARSLVVLTSDQTFGTTAGPYQHYDLSVLRAVETRRWLLRAASTGVSAIIDPYGRTRDHLDLDRAGVVVGTIHLRSDVTPYARWGDWFVAVCAVLAAGSAVLAAPGIKRGRAATSPA